MKTARETCEDIGFYPSMETVLKIEKVQLDAIDECISRAATIGWTAAQKGKHGPRVIQAELVKKLKEWRNSL